MTIAHGQITLSPYVGSQKSKLISISSVATNALFTTVVIDFQEFVLQSSNNFIWIGSDTYIEYYSNQTRAIKKLKAISLDRMINSEDKFINSDFGKKYNIFTDFGTKPVYWAFRLLFPPIENGVTNLKIVADYKNSYWNNVRIEKTDYATDFEEIKNDIDDCIQNTKSIYAGEYEGLNVVWHLAFLQDKDGDYCLANTNATQPGWSIGDTWADLRPTAYPNVFIGKRYINDCSVNKITVTFDDGIMNIKDGEDWLQFIKMRGNGKDITLDTPTEWSGTGFALNDGYVVTNYHVIENAKNIEIYGINGDFSNEYNINVVGVDKQNDLALLKINDENVLRHNNPPFYYNPSIVEVGESVYVLGYPLTQTMGEEIKLTTGVVSSKSGFEGDITTYQISVPIQPGNSGGPMFDMKGNLVGIVCAKHLGAENANYAIKTAYLTNLVESVCSNSILPKSTELSGLELKDQVKNLKNFVYIIKCSK